MPPSRGTTFSEDPWNPHKHQLHPCAEGEAAPGLHIQPVLDMSGFNPVTLSMPAGAGQIQGSLLPKGHQGSPLHHLPWPGSSAHPKAAGPAEQSVIRAILCSQHTLLAQWRHGSASQSAGRGNPSLSAGQPLLPGCRTLLC